MKYQKLLLLILAIVFATQKMFGQEKEKRLIFILLIDKEIPSSNIISKGIFVIKDSTGTTKNQIPFRYVVGGLILADSDYNTLFKPGRKTKMSIEFTYLNTKTFKKYNYKHSIPYGWINEEYLIVKVYNYFNRESRMAYFLKKDGYGIEMEIPGYESVFPMRKEYLRLISSTP